ncbi:MULTISPECIES: alpha/beta fold hydrolase [Streptosporangium]|uniref:Pimeloyl-ACP methyl ester carboxylesterase n=1 Tax=Streptosporangium brasiliense TaxID=47480 RepID=A0ABT9RIY0_9ACTN|nr:alpha/beta fold hydrolase [Streptosporangium brasiliense]MDP9869033.1 pimeloyl-ACP methyl ester carboxylesterase [Streptosporangium brasiliense]
MTGSHRREPVEAQGPLERHDVTTPPATFAMFAEVDGCRVRYRVAGTGPPVILLHGLGRSLEDWEPLRAALPGYRLLAIDLAGFGHSHPLPNPRLDSLARHVMRTLDALGVTSAVHVVGNSLGGAVGMRLAADDPGRVASLALADSAGFGRRVTWALRVLDLPLLWRLLLRPDERTARSTELSLFYDPAFATPERVALAHELSQRPEAARTLRSVAAGLGSLRGVHLGWRRDLIAAVARLGIPTLITWGTHDRILPATHLVNAATALPWARIHLFSRTGHMPQIERAEEFAALLARFWDDLEIGQPPDTAPASPAP